MKKYRRGIGSVIGIILTILLLKSTMSGTNANSVPNNETASVSVCAVYNAE